MLRLADAGEPDVAIALRTAEALGLVGPLDMDVRRDEDGQPLVLEVNSPLRGELRVRAGAAGRRVCRVATGDGM